MPEGPHTHHHLLVFKTLRRARCFVCFLINTDLALQVMRRAQSNSPRIPPKKYHSFRETRNVNLDNLLLLPGYKPRRRPPSYPAHVSPSREHLHVPRIRVICVPDRNLHSSQPLMRRQSPNSRGQSPNSRGRSPNSRGRSPGRRVSLRMNRCLTPRSLPRFFLFLQSVQTDSLTPAGGIISPLISLNNFCLSNQDESRTLTRGCRHE